ncbi:WhiB family transcriptional regulator [Pseudonocardia nigra]|uniref:WhiB family transcriptional regulator n=1 Tax=Pseudonocardia nigra TaxID=1921578 RepID=UPI003556FCDA
MFFPAAVQGPEFEVQVSIAKAVCAGCPVRAECLSWALAALPEGIAGGMTEHERRVLKAGRRGARRPRGRLSQRPVGGSRDEVAAAGRAAIAAGLSVREVAARFLVTERTAARWVRAVRTTGTGTTDPSTPGAPAAGAGGGAPGGNRAPLRISHANPLAGTRAEGHRG